MSDLLSVSAVSEDAASRSGVARKKYLRVEPKVIRLRAHQRVVQRVEVVLTNPSAERAVAFKFKMRNPKKCSVRPPAGVVHPASRQVVDSLFPHPFITHQHCAFVHVLMPLLLLFSSVSVMPDEPTDGPNDCIDRFHVEMVPVSDPTNVTEAWKQSSELLRQVLKVTYDEEVPAGVAPAAASESTSSPASSAAVASVDPTLLHSCSGVEETAPATPAAPAPAAAVPAPAESTPSSLSSSELAELSAKYAKVRSERNELQARVVLLQGQNAKLQAAADAAARRRGAGTAEARAERRAWVMFVAAVLVLLAVVVHAVARTLPRACVCPPDAHAEM